MTAPLLSIVIPTLNEESHLEGILQDLSQLTLPHEVVVADGGSRDGTTALARSHGARVVLGARGRGLQLASGAAVAEAPVLCFLHADVRLPRETIAALEEIAQAPPPCALAFRFSVDAAGVGFRIIELGVRVRCRLFRLPYGDQGLILRREDYHLAGGFPPVPIMEDVMLVRALHRVTRLALRPEPVRLSPRRWNRYGVVGATLRNWALMLRFLTGTPPSRLASGYRPENAL